MAFNLNLYFIYDCQLSFEINNTKVDFNLTQVNNGHTNTRDWIVYL